jgi:hypothetical protein
VCVPIVALLQLLLLWALVAACKEHSAQLVKEVTALAEDKIKANVHGRGFDFKLALQSVLGLIDSRTYAVYRCATGEAIWSR